MMYLSDYGAIARDPNTGNWVPMLDSVQKGLLAAAYCPIATTNSSKFNVGGGSTWGTADLPWIGNDGKLADSASYFINGWMYKPDNSVDGYLESPPGVGALFGKQDNIRFASQTVLFADGIWEDGWPNGGYQSAGGATMPGDSLSPANLYSGSDAPDMGRVAIARHGTSSPSAAPRSAAANAPFPGTVNVALADSHVETAKLDTLWSTYYWHALSTPSKRPGLP